MTEFDEYKLEEKKEGDVINFRLLKKGGLVCQGNFDVGSKEINVDIERGADCKKLMKEIYKL